MERIAFTASEYQPDGEVRAAGYQLAGSARAGWSIEREGRLHLELGPGYRLLRASHCGICATDLARRHLPFPLPQITGHEVVAIDEGAAAVVEINASCLARALPPCATCAAGLPTHCPERRVLGIHDLPGGFGLWLLAPERAVLRVPAAITPLAATLVEPFAAAWHAVERIAPRDGERVLVLGPGRLGSLVVAALDAWRRRRGGALEIHAAGRSHASRERARRLGADDVFAPERAPAADVVVEATGSPEGAALSLRLARREVHFKSTHGQPALGLAHLTELVVDELTIAAAPAGEVAAAAARSEAEIDAAIRPHAGVETSAVGARGTIPVRDVGQPRSALLAAVLDRGLRLSSSRCGDFHIALEVLAENRLAERLAAALVRALVPADRLGDALQRAAGEGGKIVVTHPDGLL